MFIYVVGEDTYGEFRPLVAFEDKEEAEEYADERSDLRVFNVPRVPKTIEIINQFRGE